MVTESKSKNGRSDKPLATADMLRDAIQRRFTGVLFEVPGYNMSVEVTALKRHERESIIKAVQGDEGRWDNLLQNRMAVAFALLTPPIVDLPRNSPSENDRYVKAAIEALKEWPDSLIDPIAGEIWRISNNYTEEVEAKIEDVSPFHRMSGLPSGSLIEPEQARRSSSRGPIRSETESTSGT